MLSPMQVLSRVWQEEQTLQGAAPVLLAVSDLEALFVYCYFKHVTCCLDISQPLLECERCQNCYHDSCLGSNYPKPNRKRKAWASEHFIQVHSHEATGFVACCDLLSCVLPPCAGVYDVYPV